MATKTQKTRKHHVQLTLDQARQPVGHGGWRPGAGRPKGRNTNHDTREDFPSTIPQHVTLRLVAGVPLLRCESSVRLIRTQIALSHREDFRIVHFCIEDSNMHFIVEAAGKKAIAAGIKGLKIRIARRLNRAFDRTGELFDARYHRRSLSTPREVRNALCYVLNNERHHAEERGESVPPAWFDPFSSAPWFDGWASPFVVDESWKQAVLQLPRPTELPRTWLLNIGWRRHGLVRFDEVPGRKRARKK